MDRERLAAFSRFLLQRFWADRCFEAAGALAYATVFALVPFTTVVFVVLSVFPVFDEWTTRLTTFIFANFVPGSARGLETYLSSTAAEARELTGAGVFALLVSVFVTMWSVEQAFNSIWRVPSPRPRLVRFLLYWTLLTLGSLVMVSLLTATSAFLQLHDIGPAGFGIYLLGYLPTLLEFVSFTLAYWLIPHRTVPLRFAVAGGVLATWLFEMTKWGLALYLRNASFEQLYGALAVIPIFLLWIYTSWLVVLLGASLAASLAAFRFQPRVLRLEPGSEIYAYLRLLGRLNESRRAGTGLHLADIHQREPSLTDDALAVMMHALDELNIVKRAETGAWLLSRDLAEVPLAEIYEHVSLRIPVIDMNLPARNDAIGRAGSRAMDELRSALHDPLQRSIASYLQPHRDPNA
ncbi:MAG: YihY family inner membrane protein [Arenimonas sp.]